MPGKHEARDFVEALSNAVPWAFSSEEPIQAHILVRGESRNRRQDALIPHACSLELPSGSLCRLGVAPSSGHRVLVTSPEISLMHMLARQKSLHENLLLLWEACGSYQTSLTSGESRYEVAPLTSKSKLVSSIARMPAPMGGVKKLRSLVRFLADGSASQRETALALLMGMPFRYGGYGLGIPIMNRVVKASRQAFALTGKRSFRLDMSWPGTKLDLEYQSRYSHEGEQMRISDSRREKALGSMGWQVVGVTDVELNSLVMTNEIADIVRKAIGKRRRDFPEWHHRLKLQLRSGLGLPSR